MHWECREHFPCCRLQRKPLVSNPCMHHGTCVTHVPWCMSGSLTSGGVENAPGIPGACTTHWLAPVSGHILTRHESAFPPSQLGSDIPTMVNVSQSACSWCWAWEIFTFKVAQNSDGRKSGQPNFTGCRILSNFTFEYLKHNAQGR